MVIKVENTLPANNFDLRCYTTDPKKRWELCPVPTCDQGEHYKIEEYTFLDLPAEWYAD